MSICSKNSEKNNIWFDKTNKYIYFVQEIFPEAGRRSGQNTEKLNWEKQLICS